MHILVLPSEEYIPSYSPLAGIFQSHQIAVLLEKTDYQIGVVSINLKYSLPMIMKAMIYGLLRIKISNDLGKYSSLKLVKLAIDKLFNSEKFIQCENGGKLNIVRVEGLYYFPPSDKTDHYSWIHAGLTGYEAYVKRYGRPDIIHAHNSVNAGILALELKKKYNMSYIITEHSSYYYQNKIPEKLYPKIKSSIVNAEKFSVVSQKLKEILNEKLGQIASNAICISNVLPEIFELVNISSEKKSHKSNDKIVFLSVGNLLPIKGHERLLHAFSKVQKNNKNIVLTIVGDGAMRLHLQDLVDKLDLKNSVTLKGELSPVEVKEQMLDADVFVFPSLFETFGVAVIEAMACGLPVIATSCGGPESIVTVDTGRLVENSELGLEQGLLWAIEHAKSMDANLIRNCVIQNYGADAFYSKINQIYMDAIKSSRQKLENHEAN